MKKFTVVLMALVMVFAVTAANADDAEKSADKPVKEVKFGGRIMNDWFWADVDDNAPNADDFVSGNEFRRARFFMSGTLYGNVEFKAQYDFGGGEADFKDVWMGLKLSGAKLKVGHFKAPFSLEELTSSKYITFAERSLVNAFALGRETGVALFGAAGEKKKENITWGIGMFTDADDFGEAPAHDDTYIFAARVTFLPMYEDGDLFHLGAGFYYKDLQEGTSYRVRQRPETHLSPRVIDTRISNSDSVMTFGLEGAFVFGSAHGAAEYMMMNIDSPDNNDPELTGFYAYVGYFLTGDHRRYKTSAGAFDRTKPNSPFTGDDEGMGAWEIAGRYSMLDYDENAGDMELTTFTAALNWYLNNYTVIKFNYVYFERGDLSDATGNQFVTRFQIDF